MKKSFFVLITLFISTLVSCHYGISDFFYKANDVDYRASELKDINLELADRSSEISDSSYNVLFLTDIHFGAKNGTHLGDEFYSWLDSQKGLETYPKFVIFLGDNVDHGKESEYEDFESVCNKLNDEYGLKCYAITGNHDLYFSGWQYFTQYTYPGTSFYRFHTSNFSWYFIDTGTGTIGTKQYEALKTAMEADPNPKIVCMHYPVTLERFVYSLQNTTERNLVIELYAKNNVKAVFCGHRHIYGSSDFGYFSEYSFPSYKNFKEFGLVTVNEDLGTVGIPEVVEIQ